MTNKIEISRETAEAMLKDCSLGHYGDELRALLAAPAVERQDILPCDVRVAPATTIRKGCKVETLMQCIELRKGQPDKFTRFENSGPPAPVAVMLPSPDDLRYLISRAAKHADLTNGANFYTAAELAAEALIDKVKELNQ